MGTRAQTPSNLLPEKLPQEANQMGPAIQALKIAVELSGLGKEVERQGDVKITHVTVVLPGKEDPDDDTPALEASYRVLARERLM